MWEITYEYLVKAHMGTYVTLHSNCYVCGGWSHIMRSSCAPTLYLCMQTHISRWRLLWRRQTLLCEKALLFNMTWERRQRAIGARDNYSNVALTANAIRHAFAHEHIYIIHYARLCNNVYNTYVNTPKGIYHVHGIIRYVLIYIYMHKPLYIYVHIIFCDFFYLQKIIKRRKKKKKINMNKQIKCTNRNLTTVV